MKDKNIYLAVVLESIELIGQDLKDYGVDRLTEKQPNIPWLKITGMRNILAHEYLGVDMTLVWGTLKKDLDMLWEAVEKISSAAESNSKL